MKIHNPIITGSIVISGSMQVEGHSANTVASASYAVTSSHSLNVPVTASYALTAQTSISASHAPTGTPWDPTIKTSNFTGVSETGYFINTTSNIVKITLPVGTVGDILILQDYAGTFATNFVIIESLTQNIQGTTTEARCVISNSTITLVYQDTTQGWTADNIEEHVSTVSWITPLNGTPNGTADPTHYVYSTASPQTSVGAEGTTFPTTTFTVTTTSTQALSGVPTFNYRANPPYGSSISGLPPGLTSTYSYNNTSANNTLTITIDGTYPALDQLLIELTVDGLTAAVPPFIPSYLMVAGGGGGGAAQAYGWPEGGGGGGAGGFSSTFPNPTAFDVSGGLNTTYYVEIGSGGAAGTSASTGTNGGNTLLRTSGYSNYTVREVFGGGGGGGGNYAAPTNGNNGGSGGGAGASGAMGGPPGGNFAQGGTTTSNGGFVPLDNNGYDGGSGFGDPMIMAMDAGGGGGAASSGGSNGGNGLASTITGVSLFYAAGGGAGGSGGGSGGSSIGGDGADDGSNANATSPTQNTGAGGGGGSAPVMQSPPALTPSNGANGIMIFKFSGASFNPAYGHNLTYTTTTVGSDTVIAITAGTGEFQFN